MSRILSWQLGFLGFQLFQAVSLCGHLLLDLLGFGGLAGVLFSLAHQHANLFGKLVAVGAQGVTLANGGAVLGIQIDDLVYQRQLGILKLLLMFSLTSSGCSRTKRISSMIQNPFLYL